MQKEGLKATVFHTFERLLCESTYKQQIGTNQENNAQKRNFHHDFLVKMKEYL